MVSFSPCIEQVQRTCQTMTETECIIDLRIMECIAQEFRVKSEPLATDLHAYHSQKSIPSGTAFWRAFGSSRSHSRYAECREEERERGRGHRRRRRPFHGYQCTYRGTQGSYGILNCGTAFCQWMTIDRRRDDASSSTIPLNSSARQTTHCLNGWSLFR